jgi:D-methionine transport system ATP-binding protein
MKLKAGRHMIRFEKLGKTFVNKKQTVEALKDISLEIEKGDIYGIIGYSGAGKSTLVRMINALETPTEGKVYVNDKDLSTLSKKELRELRKGIGMIFQQFNLLESKTIYDNVAIPLKLNGTPKADIKKRVQEMLEFVELSDKANAYPNQLSGGQKQRVGIARALATNPSILLCDEATSALDPKTTDSILDLLKKVNEVFHITIVIITHEMNVIQKICNKVAVMDYGRVVETGDVLKVFSDPESETAKNFVRNLIHDTIPEPLIEGIKNEKRNARLLRIKLVNQEKTEPLLWEINQKCKVETNILYSTINVIQGAVVGIMLVHFVGSDEEIIKAEQHIIDSGEEYREVELA